MIRKAARNALAFLCLVVGIAGLFLPVIQGIAMIVLAVVIADFEAKERLLERYRHTRVGRHLWERHEARKLPRCCSERLRAGCLPDPEPDSETLPGGPLQSNPTDK